MRSSLDTWLSGLKELLPLIKSCKMLQILLSQWPILQRISWYDFLGFFVIDSVMERYLTKENPTVLG